MGCTNCKDSVRNCTSILPSTCIPFTGDLPKFFIKKEDCSIVYINDIIEQSGAKIDKLLADTDVSTIDSQCFVYDKNSATTKSLHALELKEICDLKTSVNDIKTIVKNTNISDKEVTIDLRCFKSANAACQIDNDTYTLLSVLNIIIEKLCDHESRLIAIGA